MGDRLRAAGRVYHLVILVCNQPTIGQLSLASLRGGKIEYDAIRYEMLF